MLSKRPKVMALLVVGIVGLGAAFLSRQTPAAEPGLTTTLVAEPADLVRLAHVIDDVSRLPPEAARLYAYVRRPLAPSELAYRRIPWLVDLNEAVRVARSESAPAGVDFRRRSAGPVLRRGQRAPVGASVQ